MRVVMLGLNHRTAGLELRERLALSGERLLEALDRLRARYPAAEAVIVSTCNRTEVYVARPTHEPPSGEELRALLSEIGGVSLESVRAASIHRENHEALAQLFRVCAGLDSMVLGEPQVLGQVRRAYELAAARGAVGPVLHRVFQQALAVAKQVRAQTGIDAGRMSLGSVAVDFARQIFEHFEDKVVVGVGAGELAKLALTHLRALRPAKLWLVNRTPARAEALAHKLALSGAGGVRSVAALDELLIEADIVVSGTGAAAPIITAQRFGPLVRRRRGRPLFIIDLAVPRDVEPEVGTLANVYLYNLDDLQSVVSQTQTQRGEQVQHCEAMLFEAVRECMAQVQNRDVGQLVRALRQRLHELGRVEQQRTLRKLASAPPQELPALLEEHTHRLINKVLHLPLSQLDRGDAEAPLGFYAAALRQLFGLHEAAGPGGAGSEAPPSPPAEAAGERPGEDAPQTPHTQRVEH